MSHTHWEGGPICPLPTKKACDAVFAAWEDDQYVALAAKADERYHKDRHYDANMYTQVVQVLAGTRADLTNAEGMRNMSPLAKRLRKAIARYRVVGSGQ